MFLRPNASHSVFSPNCFAFTGVIFASGFSLQDDEKKSPVPKHRANVSSGAGGYTKEELQVLRLDNIVISSFSH